MTSPELIHATCVAVNGHGVLITGPSGSGKSDLALRLIDRGARLVGDDYVVIETQDSQLYARPAPHIVGKLEIRGLGLCRFDALSDARISLYVHLTDSIERLPEPDHLLLSGVSLPILRLDPFEASAPIKIELALSHGVGVT